MRHPCCLIYAALMASLVPALCAFAQNEKETWFCLIDGKGLLTEVRGEGWFLRGNTVTGDKTYPFIQLKQIERLAEDRLLVTLDPEEGESGTEKEQEEVFAPTIGCAASSLYGEYFTTDGLRHVVSADVLFKTYCFVIIHGELKYNPETKKYYPPDYEYDPYTRKRLVEWNREQSPLTGIKAARAGLMAIALSNWINQNGPMRSIELHAPRLRDSRMLHDHLVELFGRDMDELLDDAVAEAKRRKLLEETVVGTDLDSEKQLRSTQQEKPALVESVEELTPEAEETAQTPAEKSREEKPQAEESGASKK